MVGQVVELRPRIPLSPERRLASLLAIRTSRPCRRSMVASRRDPAPMSPSSHAAESASRRLVGS